MVGDTRSIAVLGPRVAARRTPSAAETVEDSAQEIVETIVAIGAVAAGVALFEAALVPGIVVGGVAMLTPRLMPGLRRRIGRLYDSVERRIEDAMGSPQPRGRRGETANEWPASLSFSKAAAKTITFRVVVTCLDFTANYLVLGELGMAAGLSAFSLVAGPAFYFVHELGWNYLRTADGPVAEAIREPGLADGTEERYRIGGLTVSRTLAKTITYRIFATTTEFTANYIVVGEAATAAMLSAFGFVIGPFVYYMHEKAWSSGKPDAEKRPRAELITPDGTVMPMVATVH